MYICTQMYPPFCSPSVHTLLKIPRNCNMKTPQRISFLLILMILGVSVHAQKMRLEIGMPYSQAIEKLRAEQGIEIVSETENQEIEVVENLAVKGATQEIFYSFEFKEGKISVITISSTYEKQGSAKKVYEEFVGMAAANNAEPLEFFESEDYTRYILVKSGKPGEVYGFHLKTLGKTAFQFRASVASCIDCPK